MKIIPQKIQDILDCADLWAYDDEHPGPPDVEWADHVKLMRASPAMYAALEKVLSWFTNVNAYETSEVVAAVFGALRAAGIDAKELDDAGVAMLRGACRNELLAALETCVRSMAMSGCDMLHPTYQNAAKAIAKAKKEEANG